MRAITRNSLSRRIAQPSVTGLFGLAAAALLLMSPPPARADITWTLTTTGDWSIPTNWSGGAVPTSRATADIFNGGTVTITRTGEVCYDLSLGGTAGSGFVQMTSGALAVSDTDVGGEFVGYTGVGNFVQSGGTNTVSNALLLGYMPGSSGTYVFSGSGRISTMSEDVGFYGTGNFVQSGGTNTVSNYLNLGTYGSGTFSLSDTGLLSAPKGKISAAPAREPSRKPAAPTQPATWPLLTALGVVEPTTSMAEHSSPRQ